MTVTVSGPIVLTTTAHEYRFQMRAIEQAKLSKSEPGKVSPKVGAVLVRNAQVLGEAYRGELGEGEHAEYTLLERKLSGVDVSGATLYTTLEPCTTRHDPKRPCAHRIIDRGITQVVIGIIDPNELIRGDGWWTLREAGIKVDIFLPVLHDEVEQLSHEFAQHHRGRTRRIVAETREPLPTGQIGSNGGRIGHMPNGDKVEWLPFDDGTGEEGPMILRRNDKAIAEMYSELWDKVWYNRQQVRRERIASGEVELTDVDKRLLKSTETTMRALERKYGKKNLRFNDLEWGLISGRMSALAWVLGSDWDESLDT